MKRREGRRRDAWAGGGRGGAWATEERARIEMKWEEETGEEKGGGGRLS